MPMAGSRSGCALVGRSAIRIGPDPPVRQNSYPFRRLRKVHGIENEVPDTVNCSGGCAFHRHGRAVCGNATGGREAPSTLPTALCNAGTTVQIAAARAKTLHQSHRKPCRACYEGRDAGAYAGDQDAGPAKAACASRFRLNDMVAKATGLGPLVGTAMIALFVGVGVRRDRYAFRDYSLYHPFCSRLNTDFSNRIGCIRCSRISSSRCHLQHTIRQIPAPARAAGALLKRKPKKQIHGGVG